MIEFLCCLFGSHEYVQTIERRRDFAKLRLVCLNCNHRTEGWDVARGEAPISARAIPCGNEVWRGIVGRGCE